MLLSNITSPAVGNTSDTPWSGSGNGTMVAILKSLWTKLGSITIANGSVTITNGSSVMLSGNVAGITSQVTIANGSAVVLSGNVAGITGQVSIANGSSVVVSGSNVAPIVILSNASANSGNTAALLSGRYIWSAAGTFNGATLTLQSLLPGNTAWADVTTLTANGQALIDVASNDVLKIVVSAGPPSAVYSSIAKVI